MRIYYLNIFVAGFALGRFWAGHYPDPVWPYVAIFLFNAAWAALEIIFGEEKPNQR